MKNGKENLSLITKTIRNTVIILVSAVIIGYLLIVLSYALPLSPDPDMRARTVETMKDEGRYPSDSHSGRTIDNWADSFVFLISEYDGPENAFEKAADAYYLTNNRNPYLYITGTGGGNEPVRVEYARYWHGYVLFIRPLMRLADYEGIRTINFVVIAFLMVPVFIIMTEKMRNCVIPFLLSVFLLAPTAMAACIEYFYMMVIMLIMCLIVMSDHAFFIKKGRMKYFFLICGIAAAYFDFLTAPLITLLMPVTLMYIKRKDEEDIFRLAAVCMIMWAAGYAGMWFGKWVIAFISERQDFIASLTSSIDLRASAALEDGEEISRLQAITKNFSQLFGDGITDVLILIYAGMMICGGILKEGTGILRDMKGRAFLLIPLAAALCWYLVFANHSVVHSRLHTYRTAVPAVFGVLCALDPRNGRTDHGTE